MKKRMLLLVCLGLTLCLLSGCTFLPMTLGSLRNASGTGSAAAVAESGEDTVTISREQYERYKQFDKLLNLMDTADLYFYKDTDHEKMLHGAAAGLLEGLEDVYTFYYTPEQWQQMWEDDKGEYAGLGILISANYATGLCTISRVFKGSPAEAAGVQRGDILYKVNNDLTVTAETLQEAVSIMRGTPGTFVDVTFLRNGEEITMTIERANVVVNEIESTMLTDEIGYIALYEFAGSSDEEFTQAFRELEAKGAKGLLVDLRDNPGGWVNQAQNIADLFMDEGDLCYLVYRDGVEDHCYQTKNGKTEIPMVILVNENTASSSEILTGSLRERANATVVGVTTFGKGVVQAVMEAGTDGSGFQMTIAEYLLPSGAAVHEKGIEPDVVVPLEEGDNGSYKFADLEKDTQLIRALEVLREKLQ